MSHLCVDLRIFMSFDLAALIIQAIGGRNAPIAMKQGNDAEPGGKIMMYGAIVQMIGMTLVWPLILNQYSLAGSHPS